LEKTQHVRASKILLFASPLSGDISMAKWRETRGAFGLFRQRFDFRVGRWIASICNVVDTT
jgi:hypothetical protein